MTNAELRAGLLYDPVTGAISWKDRAAGYPSAAGYLRLRIEGALYYAHRLAWLYMVGEWPRAGVDHRDGDTRNNSWANLRSADQALNNENRRAAAKHNRTGLLGVERNGSAYAARIRVRGHRIYIGTFRTPELAHAAYLAAKRKLHEGCTI